MYQNLQKGVPTSDFHIHLESYANKFVALTERLQEFIKGQLETISPEFKESAMMEKIHEETLKYNLATGLTANNKIGFTAGSSHFSLYEKGVKKLNDRFLIIRFTNNY